MRHLLRRAGQPGGTREIREHTVRVRAPLADNAIIDVRSRNEVSGQRVLRFGSIGGLDVVGLKFHFSGRRLLVGSTHGLGLPFTPPVLVLNKKRDVAEAVGKAIRAYQRDERYAERLRLLRETLQIGARQEPGFMPDALLLFNNITISRLDTAIDFGYAPGGYSYTITALGADYPVFVEGQDCKFINIRNSCFIAIRKSDIFVRDWHPEGRIFADGGRVYMPPIAAQLQDMPGKAAPPAHP